MKSYRLPIVSLLWALVLIAAACARPATPTPGPTPPTAIATPAPATPVAVPPPAAPPPTAAVKLPEKLVLAVDGEKRLEWLLLCCSNDIDLAVGNTVEPLIYYDENFKPVPGLAVKWEQLSPTRWRLYLREGVKFHNGDPFTAQDVVGSVWLNAQVKGTVHTRFPAKEAIRVDRHIVDIVFDNPQPFFLLMQRYFRIYPVALARDPDLLKRTVIGTGPYKLVDWELDRYKRYARNEEYWGAKPPIKEYEVRMIRDTATREAALRAGEVQWVNSVSLEGAPKLPKFVEAPNVETAWLRLNPFTGPSPILADVRLRKAIQHAIDYPSLFKLFGGHAMPANRQFALPQDFGFVPDMKEFTYDLEKARSLVREAGAVGKVLTFATTAGRYLNEREITELVALNIEQTGLKINLVSKPKAEYDKYIRMRVHKEVFADIAFGQSDNVLETESMFFKHFAGGTYGWVFGPKTEAMLADIQRTLDLQEREAKLRAAWRYVYEEEAYYIALLRPAVIWGLAPNLEWKPPVDQMVYVAHMRYVRP